MNSIHKVFINLDSIKTFWPLISAQLLNAYYSAFLLKKLSGVEMTDQVVQETIEEIFDQYGAFEKMISFFSKPEDSGPSSPERE